jgi:Spy/CpxP family protein refolding chaperone
MGVVIFAAGGICGAAAVRMMPGPKPLASLSELPGRVAERMQYDLGLTDAQRQGIEQIVQAHQPQLHRIRARIVPEMRTELRQLVEEMSAVLAPEQAQRFRPQAEHRLDVHFPEDDVTPDDEPGPR